MGPVLPKYRPISCMSTFVNVCSDHLCILSMYCFKSTIPLYCTAFLSETWGMLLTVWVPYNLSEIGLRIRSVLLWVNIVSSIEVVFLWNVIRDVRPLAWVFKLKYWLLHDRIFFTQILHFCVSFIQTFSFGWRGNIPFLRKWNRLQGL